jgi:Transcription elongation factor, GreA/GreB, C-term
MKTKNMQVITVGCHVELNLVDRQGKKDHLSLDIVTDEAADVERGFLGASTPLARVLLGEKAGEVIPYLKDDILAIEVLGVTGSTKRSPEDSQEKRQAQMMKTLREVEHTSAVMFASSFSGKWGDYDPASLPEVDQTTESSDGDAGDDLANS